MSIIKYTTKYLIRGGLVLIVIIGIGTLIYSQVQKGRDTHEQAVRPAQVPDTSDPPRQSLRQKITPKLKKKPSPKTPHSHVHSDAVEIPPDIMDFAYPRDLQERLDKLSANGNSYYTNPNFFQELYDAVSDGRDMETTIEILKKYNIFTDVVLEYMEPYEAFQYALRAPMDFRRPAGKYAERVFNEDPSSPEGLEAGLYMAGGEEHDLRRVLKYHPNSAMVLFQLGYSIEEERPSEAIVYLKRAAQLGQIGIDRLGLADHTLGIAYQRLGDYKSAWIHFKRADALDGGHPWNQSHLEAIANGEPAILPIKRKPIREATGQNTAPPVVDTPSPDFEVFVDTFVVPEDVPAELEAPDDLSPEALARQEAEHQAFLEMLREREEFARRLAEDEQFKAEYFQEVEAFIKWAESTLNDTPIDTNNFLEKEMEQHLLGKQTTFDPDRIKRGFEFINKYGQADGLKRLQQSDPDLAKQVTQQKTW